MEAIRVKQLAVSYENHCVLENFDLNIPKGKITVLIGANGCGKSTLLKTIARVIKAKKGEIYVNNQSIKHQKDREMARQIAFLPQSPICPSGITVSELVAFGRFPHQNGHSGLSKKDLEVIDWAISEVGLEPLRSKPVDELSGGQRQRAWIAMTLAQETDIILLDEPTTYLDMSYQLEVLEVLKNLNQTQKKTFVIVLHELNHACRFADHIVGMKNGVRICEGSPQSVITQEVLKELFGIFASLTLSDDGGYPICMSYELERKQNGAS